MVSWEMFSNPLPTVLEIPPKKGRNGTFLEVVLRAGAGTFSTARLIGLLACDARACGGDCGRLLRL